MDIEKRYSGKGNPIDHDHFYSRKKKDRRLDVLAFKDGSFAVWNPDIEECISFHDSWTTAEMEAKRILG